jgi:hypothetical protein
MAARGASDLADPLHHALLAEWAAALGIAGGRLVVDWIEFPCDALEVDRSQRSVVVWIGAVESLE